VSKTTQLYIKNLINIAYSSLFTICGDACPFHASMLRPASQAGPMHESAAVGKLVNALLLSLINEACVNVLHYYCIVY